MSSVTAAPGTVTGAGDDSPGPKRRLPFFYGWVIAGVGFVINTLNGALLFHSFGIYVVLLQAEFGWSRTSFAFAFALMRVESGLLGPIEGWAIDRFGPRAVMRVGVVIFAVGLIMLSQINSLLTFYVVFLVIAMGSALGSFLPISVAVVNWFSRRRALALAALSLGFSAGGLIQPIVVFGMETLGWRGMSALSGLIVLAVGLPLTALVRHRPEDYGYLPDGDTAEQAASRAADGHQEIDFTPGQALRTRAFWLLGLGHSASLLVFGAVSVHFVAHVTEGLGFSLGTAAGIITLMTAMMVVGQVTFGGFWGDRVNKRLVIVIAMFGHTVALVILAFATSLLMVLVFAVINGLAMGTRGPLTQAMRAEYFGRASFGTIMGLSSLIMMVGIVTGPVVAGLSYDTTGSYQIGFVLLAVLSGAGSMFFVFAAPPPPPVTVATPRDPGVLERGELSNGRGFAPAAGLLPANGRGEEVAAPAAMPEATPVPDRAAAGRPGARTLRRDYMGGNGQGAPREERDYMNGDLDGAPPPEHEADEPAPRTRYPQRP